VLGCTDGAREGGTASVLCSAPSTMAFQAEIYAIEACILENIDRAMQVGTSVFFLTGSHQGPR
jgi:hypothetical protein